MKSLQDSEYYYLNVSLRTLQQFVMLGFGLDKIIESEMNVPVLYVMKLSPGFLAPTVDDEIKVIVDCRAPVVNMYTNSPHIIYLTDFTPYNNLSHVEEQYLRIVLDKYNEHKIDSKIAFNIIEMYHNKLCYGDTTRKPWLPKFRNNLTFLYHMIKDNGEIPPDNYYTSQLQ